MFPADFDVAAIAAVCEAEDVGGEAVISLLPRLVDKSLVSPLGRGTRRYRLLETIRTYAAWCLAESGSDRAARDRHAAHYIAWAEQAAGWLRTADQRVWLDRMVTEQPNLRAALAHSTGAGDSESVWRMIGVAAVLGSHRSAPRRSPVDPAGAGPPRAAHHARRRRRAGRGQRELDPLDARAAFDLARRARRLAVGLDDLTRARAARAVGTSATWIRPALVGPALRSMFAGIADDEVHAWLTESRALAEAAGSEANLAHATVGFGQWAWLRGEHDRAAELMSECLPTLRRLGDRRCAGRALCVLGQRAYQKGEPARAEELLRASVEAIALAGQSYVLVSALEALAAVHAAQHRPRGAAVLLGAAHSVREAAGAHLRPVQPPDPELRQALVRALGAAAFDDAHSHGERLTPEKALRAVPSVEASPA